MKSADLSIAEAARHLSEYVDAVRSGSIEFRLLKDGTPVARLTSDFIGCSTSQLAEDWNAIRLPEIEAQALWDDMDLARRELPPPRDKWQ